MRPSSDHPTTRRRLLGAGAAGLAALAGCSGSGDDAAMSGLTGTVLEAREN